MADSGPSGVSHLASFGRGAGPVWLGDTACTGNESSLIDCPASPLGVHNCTPSTNDAGVNCRCKLHLITMPGW